MCTNNVRLNCRTEKITTELYFKRICSVSKIELVKSNISAHVYLYPVNIFFRYCNKPASVAPFEWDKSDITKWPVSAQN